MSSSQSERVVVVTGAKSGIGLATSRRLAAEGYSVVMADFEDATPEAEDIATRSESTVLAHRADVRDAQSVDVLFQRVDSELGRLDALVNGAGVAGRVAVPDATLEDWSYIVDTNLKGVFLCCRAAIPRLRPRGGAIVNIASELALVGGANLGIYCASKGGVVALTRALACDHTREGIRVNCVCPGPVQTPMIERRIQSAEDPEALRREYAAITLMNRVGQPHEIANVIHFLLSDEASFMVGSVVVVDGGTTVR